MRHHNKSVMSFLDDLDRKEQEAREAKDIGWPPEVDVILSERKQIKKYEEERKWRTE